MSPTANFKTLAIITDELLQEFVRKARKGIEAAMREAGWRGAWIESGKMSVNMRMTMLKQMSDSGRYAAAMYVHLGLTPQETELFDKTGLPLGYLAGQPQGTAWVIADESEGARLATQHLLKLGHKKIALVSAPKEFEESRQRQSGYRKALSQEGLTPMDSYIIYQKDWSKEAGKKAGKQLLSLSDRPTAVFVCAGDLAARGVMQAAHEEMLEMPRRWSVIGYDDMSFAADLIPSLTTVRQPIQKMAHQLTQGLIAYAENRENKLLHDHIKPELIVRQSTAPPPA